jgi:competence protein ComEC
MIHKVKKLLKNWKHIALGLLIFSNLIIWQIVMGARPKDHITVSFLNIGQGDAILIESTNNNHILLDGGPNKKVLSELNKTLPFLNRDIDVMVESHPDKDHIGGLPEVVSRYHVGVFLEPGVESPNKVDDELRKRVADKKIQHIFARAGQIIDMGDGSYLKILFPDRDVSGFETNDASIVAQFVYGDTCFLLTGDSPSKIEEYIIGKYKEQLKCTVLKAGHHGSKGSTSNEYLHFVLPDYAVISAGKGNSYGHPHKETLDRLNSFNVKILSTIDLGTIQMISDGNVISQK